MNSNRSRYTYTPTYGMQKRSFVKKAAPVRPAAEQPDFSQAPDPLTGIPVQQPVTMQPSPVYQQPPMNSAPYYMPQVPVQNMAPVQVAPNTQMQFVMPSFIQSGMPLPAQQSPMQPPVTQPLGNSVQPLQSNGAFSSRAQGFVPPAPQPQPATAPTVRLSMPATQPPFAAPQQPMPPFGSMQPPVQPVPMQQPYMYSNVPGSMPASQAIPQQPAHVKPPRKPMDFDQLWSVFLFGVLPVLFIPCLFASGLWSFVRYLFIAAVLAGLGVMWYRQQYTSTIRLIVSGVYVALCIGLIAMSMQGTADVRQTNANMTQSAAQQQQQPAPESAGEAAVPVDSYVAEVTPTPAPVSGPSEAERRLELFMNLWAVNNTTEMVHLVQPSWCSVQENPSMALFMVLANRTPEDFVIEEISGNDTDNSRTVTMRATINKNTGKAPSVFRFMIMMVREGGEWYVNPNSLATNDEQAAASDENVVKTQSVGVATEAPRTTVTPPPPASTSLYYNIGGSSYHMDANCPSVNASNLPFDVTFSYGDLKEVKNANNLVPCLRCGAPTNILE